MTNSLSKQIQNRNYLSPIGFDFTLTKDPKVSFFSNYVRIPEINLGVANQPTYLKDIDVPGDKVTYGDFNLRFFVDENLVNYMIIHNWITDLGFSETTQDYKELIINDQGIRDPKEVFSDGSLRILNSSYNTVAIVKFKDLFPVSLTSLDFESGDTDINYFTSEVVFKYTIYNIVGKDGKPL